MSATTEKATGKKGKASGKAAPAAQKQGDETKESARDAARRKKDEATAAARTQAIETGDLVVTKSHEFSTTDKVPGSAKVIQKIIEAYKKSSTPLVFNEVAAKAGAKYPEDLIAAFYSLEHVGQVKRFAARSVSGTDHRPRVAFLWVN